MKAHGEAGYTILESLVAVSILAIASVGFYSVLFSGTRASTTTEEVTRVSEEARVGLNRMIRDTREGQLFSDLQPQSYNVRVDFDGDGNFETPNEAGDYENLNFVYDATQQAIELNGEVLVRGVQPIQGTPIFTYTSNDLRYDWNGDGVTTSAELNEAAARGYSGISSSNTALYSNVHFAFRVQVGDRATNFRGQAQLRNRR
jgi:prepilin-type N-terminal cleavage/methylation domain-containing protein